MCVKNNKKNRADMKDSFSKRVPFEIIFTDRIRLTKNIYSDNF